MEKFTFNKKWYESHRLKVALVAIILLVANDMFGLGLPEGTVDQVVNIALMFIGAKSVQDAAASYAEVKGRALVEASKKLDPS